MYIVNEATDTWEKRRTGGRRSDVCTGVVSGWKAVLVATIWTIRMTIAPVDVLDALVSDSAFELVRRAFPLCVLFCSADIGRAKNAQFYTCILNLCTFMYIHISKQKPIHAMQTPSQTFPRVKRFQRRNIFVIMGFVGFLCFFPFSPRQCSH